MKTSMFHILIFFVSSVEDQVVSYGVNMILTTDNDLVALNYSDHVSHFLGVFEE